MQKHKIDQCQVSPKNKYKDLKHNTTVLKQHALSAKTYEYYQNAK